MRPSKTKLAAFREKNRFRLVMNEIDRAESEGQDLRIYNAAMKRQCFLVRSYLAMPRSFDMAENTITVFVISDGNWSLWCPTVRNGTTDESCIRTD